MNTLLTVSVILCYSSQFLYSLDINHAPHPVTTPRPTPEHNVYHGLYFHYSRGSAEHLLLVFLGDTTHDCFVMPLSDQDVQDIQNPKGMLKMETHLVYQLAHKHFYHWSYDDYEVRDAPWSKMCQRYNGTIYRVYRI